MWHERKVTEDTGLFCSVLHWKLRVSQVDFDAPLGYKEPERQPQHQEEPTVRTDLLHKSVSGEQVKWVNVFTGRRRSQQLCRHGHRLQGEYMLVLITTVRKEWLNWRVWHLNTLIQAFTGSGNRLDGKTKGIEPSPAPLGPSDIKRWIYFFTIKKFNAKFSCFQASFTNIMVFTAPITQHIVKTGQCYLL